MMDICPDFSLPQAIGLAPLLSPRRGEATPRPYRLACARHYRWGLGNRRNPVPDRTRRTITTAAQIGAGAAEAISAIRGGAPSGQQRVLIGAGGALLSAAPTTGPAAPFVAAAGAMLGLIGAIFHGANPLQIPAAQAEQIYEAASDNAYALAKAGMITPVEAVDAMQQFLSMGVNHLQQLGQQIGNPAAKAIANMQNVIQNEIAAASKLSSVISQPVDVGKARGYYISGGGWYPDSIQAGAALMDNYLVSVVPAPESRGEAPPRPYSSVRAGRVAMIPAASWPLLALAALGIYLIVS